MIWELFFSLSLSLLGSSFARECAELLGSVDSFFGEFCFAFVAGVGLYRVGLLLYKGEDLGKSLLTSPPPRLFWRSNAPDTEYCLFWISFEERQIVNRI